MSDNKISKVAATATAAVMASSNAARSANIESTPSMSSAFLGSLPVTSETSVGVASALNTAPTTAAPTFHANRLLASAASAAASVANQATNKPITASSFAETLRRFFFNEIELPPLPEKHRNLIIALTTGVAAGSALWSWYRAHINRQDRKDKIEFAMCEIIQYCETMPEEEWEAGLNDPENFIGLLHLEIVRNTKKILDNSERNIVLAKCKRHIHNRSDAHFRQRKRQKRQAVRDAEVEAEYEKLLEESGSQVQVPQKGASVKEAGPLLGGPKLTPGPRLAGRRHKNIEWHLNNGSGGATPGRKTIPHYPGRGPFTPSVHNPPKNGRRPSSRPKHSHSPAIPSPLTRTPEAPSSESHTPAGPPPVVAPEVGTSIANSPIASLKGGTPPGYPPNQSPADGPQEGLRSSPLPLPLSSTPTSSKGRKHSRSSSSSSSSNDDDEVPPRQPRTLLSAGHTRTQLGPSVGGKTLTTTQIIARAFDPNALGNRPYQSPVPEKRKKLGLDKSGRPGKRSRSGDFSVMSERDNEERMFATIFEGASPQVDPPAGVPTYRVSESKGYWREILKQRGLRELQRRIFGTAPAQKVQEPVEQVAEEASPVERYQQDEEAQMMEDIFNYEDHASEQLVGEEPMDEETGAGAPSSDVNAAPTTSDLLGVAEEILDAKLQEAERGMEEGVRWEQQTSVNDEVNEAPVPSSPPRPSLPSPPRPSLPSPPRHSPSAPPANPTVPVLLVPVAAAVAVAFSTPAVQRLSPQGTQTVGIQQQPAEYQSSTVTAPQEPAESPQRDILGRQSQQLETVEEVDEGLSPSPAAEAATAADAQIQVKVESPPDMAPPARNTRTAAARRASTNPPSSSVSALPTPSRPPRRLSASRIPTGTRQVPRPRPAPVMEAPPAPPAPKRRASVATPAPKRRTPAAKTAPKRRTPAATPATRREPTAAPVAEPAPTPGTRQSSRVTRFKGTFTK
ncbi:hypothetical protein IAQ61_008086 [Plenodomus lingam]|uniref:uncharacterized protein n=1 Tax=Leptosphaeria maculans TaxID=5022 RepID=UPI00331EA66C|nr:hypothetical protein IAQ61_008086 [Plenodomus lingam]